MNIGPISIVRYRWLLAATIAICFVLIGIVYFGRAGNTSPTPTSAEPHGHASMGIDARPRAREQVSELPSANKNKAPAQTTSSLQSKSPKKKGYDLAEFVKAYPDLVNRANNGDSEAALELYSGLKQCIGVPHTQEAFQDFQNQLLSEYKPDSQAYTNSLEFMRSQYQNCSQFSLEQVDFNKNWLSLAARLGNGTAKVAFIMNGPHPDPDTYYQDIRQYQADAQRYLNDELTVGNADALFAASVSYGKNGGFQPDVVKEYEYLYAYVLAKSITQGAIFEHLQELAKALPASDLAEAANRGEGIYKSCCAIE